MLGTKTERVAALFHRYLESGQNWLTGGRQRLRKVLKLLITFI